MNGAELDTLYRTSFVNGLSNDVHDPAQSRGTDRDLDGGTSVDDFLTTDETFCTVHSNGADSVLSEVGSNLKNETTARKILDLQGVENGREVLSLKLNIYNGTNDCLDRAYGTFCFSCICTCYVAKS